VQTMNWNFWDVLRAPRLGFSAKKIWVGFVGLFLSLVVYSIFSYAALMTNGWSLQMVWQAYRFIPVPLAIDFGVWGWILMIVGLILALFIKLLAFTAIGKIAYEQLRGDEFYEMKEGIKFAFKNWKGVILSPVGLALIVIVLLALGLIFGLIGRIPFFGPLVIGVMWIPLAMGALFVVYLGVVLIASLVIGPAVVATTKSDTFDTMFESFSVLNEQPWRLVLWNALLLVVSGIGGAVLWVFTKGAVRLAFTIIGILMGTQYPAVVNNGFWYLPPCPPPLEGVCAKYLPLLLESQIFMSNGVTWAQHISAFLVGLSLYFIGMFVVAYFYASWASGQVLIYTVLVKIKDERDLLERKEEEQIEEVVPPAAEPEPAKVESLDQPGDETSSQSSEEKKE
jgi:hypothetical protein